MLYNLIDVETDGKQTFFKLTTEGNRVASQIIKNRILKNNTTPSNNKVQLSKSKIKLLKSLRYDPLPLSKIEKEINEPIQKIQNYLKYLTVCKLVDVELDENKTLYHLTDEGKRIVENIYSELESMYGPLWGKKYYINGVEFKSKKQLQRHIMEIIKTYKEDSILSTTHEKIITDLLRNTDFGPDLIKIGISKIKVIQNKEADVLEIIMNDGSNKIILAHCLFYDSEYNHKEDLKFGFRGAILPTGTLDDEFKYYHDGLPMWDLISNFLDKNNISPSDVIISRKNIYPEIENQNLKDRWIDFYNKHARILILTQSEIDSRNAIKNITKKCQEQFDICNVRTIGTVSTKS